ncbi:MAG: 4Fe-4S cluster-binding domain-containing protein [Oscillospiraceae bacterium]|jgi:putative pyruvate formate lyase activating enzyme
MESSALSTTCILCPRHCEAVRTSNTGSGLCGVGLLPTIARAAPHFGEEPCISGTCGSGTIFFSGCNLQCVFCQNHEISRGSAGTVVTIERLRTIFLELQAQGVHNLNLVTPSHYAPAIAEALTDFPLQIPVVYNSSGYDSLDALHMLDGCVDIYLPDLKYLESAPAARYSRAANYPEVAKAAILEMYRQTGPAVFDDNGMLQRGVLIRHLMLPGCLENTFSVLDWVSDTFPAGSILFSLMGQYTPMPGLSDFPELQQPISEHTYYRAVRYLKHTNITAGFLQELDASGTELIPDFDGTGV